MVNVLRQLIRSGNLADVESLKRDVTLALVGGIAAVMMTFWSHTGMSPNDRWSDGYDFLEAGCVLWVPIFHVFFLISAKRILTRRSTDRV